MNKAVLVLPFLLLSLLLAIWSGWIRIGWSLPLTTASAQHGALMVGSFLASLIFLERAVTFSQKWVLLLPLVNGLSGVAFLGSFPLVAQALLVVGTAGFLIMCGYFIYRHKELYYYVFFSGAFTLLTGNIILLKTHFYPVAVPWWMGFLLFTIVAERLELSRFLKIKRWKQNLLLALLALLIVSLFLPFHGPGHIAFACLLIAVSLWLLKYDMARHSIRIKGQHRYSALLLITGYVWLLVTGLVFIFSNYLPFGYDAALHSFFVGFVFSMIFSHAPIILPAVLKLPIKLFRPFLYWWFLLLQLSLLLRVGADIGGHQALRKIGGLMNGVAILLFFVSVLAIVRQELKKRKLLQLSKR